MKNSLSAQRRAIFLDRDGTINKNVGHLTRPEQMELIDGAAEAIRMINKSGFLAIVVTNQPVIARGDVTWEELLTIHDKMKAELGKQGAFVDAIYLCPHHPKSGVEGERPEYKRVCDCRKPKPGLLLRAAADYNIDLSQSYMIGDFVWDVQAGQAAGVKRALMIETNKPDALLCAVKEIIRRDGEKEIKSWIFHKIIGIRKKGVTLQLIKLRIKNEELRMAMRFRFESKLKTKSEKFLPSADKSVT